MVGGPDVRRVLLQGRRLRRPHLDIHWLAAETAHSRLGLIVPRFRHTAPERNRLRRRIKEIWRRELQHLLPPRDVVVRARRETYRASFAALREEMHSLHDGAR